jgi:hypothetical protein
MTASRTGRIADRCISCALTAAERLRVAHMPHTRAAGGGSKIIEAYYSFPLFSWRMTFDYRFVARLQSRPRPGLGHRHAPARAILMPDEL